MSSICFRCAIRQRIREASYARVNPTRAFSSYPASQRAALPQFTSTSQPELDNVLASLRDKHLIPAALTNRERNLIYKDKYKRSLADNPEVVTIGDEDVELHHINRLTDVPSLKSTLLPKMIELMAKGESSDWNNLPAVLMGLKKAKQTPSYDTMGKIARKAIEAGRFNIILVCLQQADMTEMTLRKPDILQNVIYALRDVARRDQWSEEATSKALSNAKAVAMLLEDKEHQWQGVGERNDPRMRPDVLAVYLELAAVYAFKHQDGKDVDGKVKAYAERLLSNMKTLESVEGTQAKSWARPSSTSPASTGPQTKILRGVSIYHGLHLASHMLGSEMPMAEFAQQVVREWQTGLTALTEGLKTQATEQAGGKNRWPKGGSYGGQALKAWRSCLKIDSA